MKLQQFVPATPGGVLVPPTGIESTAYADGIEAHLLEEYARLGDLSTYSPELRSIVRDWATRYHTTPYRATPFDAIGLSSPDVSLLELGAGCGAVTRWLGERLGRVSAVEGAYPRAQVARERCRDLSNVDVYAANFFDLDMAGEFDAVTLIGVAEYAPIYHPTVRDRWGSFVDTLRLARSAIDEDGALFLAIENKMGLKYLSGAGEDHTGRAFDGIQGYPRPGTAVTFSARELELALREAGYGETRFLLPFPDYKLPRTIIDADLAEREGLVDLHSWIDTPFEDYGGSRQLLYNEALALRSVAQAGLLRELSNSFFVIAAPRSLAASSERLGLDESWVARAYSLERSKRFMKRLTLPRGGADTVVIDRPEGVPEPDSAAPQLLRQRLADERLARGELLTLQLFERATQPDFLGFLVTFVDRFEGWLVEQYGIGLLDADERPLLSGEAIDAMLWNVVVDDAGAWQVIDREWTFDGVLPCDYVLWRTLSGLLYRYGAYLRPHFGSISGPDFAAKLLAARHPSVERWAPEYLAFEDWQQLVVRHGSLPQQGGLPLAVREWTGLHAGSGRFNTVTTVAALRADERLLPGYAAAVAGDVPATLAVLAERVDDATVAEVQGLLEHAGIGDETDVLLSPLGDVLIGDFALPHALLGSDPATPGSGGVRRYEADGLGALRSAVQTWSLAHAPDRAA